MNHLIKRLSSFALVALFVVFLIPAPQAGATDIADIDFLCNFGRHGSDAWNQ